MCFIPKVVLLGERACNRNVRCILITCITKFLIVLNFINNTREFLIQPSAMMGFFLNIESLRSCQKSQAKKLQLTRTECLEFSKETKENISLEAISTIIC